MAELTGHARTADQRRRIGNMLGRFGNRGDACESLAIVAVGTATHDAGVVHRPAGKAARAGIARRMASLARPAGRQVVYRLGYRRHPGKYLSIMTSRASAGDAGVVHYTRVIARAIMAERTSRGRRQVIGRLAAAGCNRETGCRGMAAFARCHARRGVGRGYGLGFRRHTVKGNAHVLVTMASRTTTEDAGMVHRRSAKTARRRLARGMAGLARHAGRQVVRWLGDRRDTGKYLAIVAIGASADDAGVIHLRSGE